MTRKQFWSKIQIGNPDECWPWLCSKNSWGYGTLGLGKNCKRIPLLAHRVAYALTYGPIPKGIKILHHCDYPACCNYNHLFKGSDLDNARDREQKRRGNHPKGVDASNVKLNDAKVRQIRNLWKRDKSLSELAQLFNTHRSCIHKIVTYKTWRHLG